MTSHSFGTPCDGKHAPPVSPSTGSAPALNAQTQHTDCTGTRTISFRQNQHPERAGRSARHNHILLGCTRADAASGQRDPYSGREIRCTRHHHMTQASTGYRFELAVENDIPVLRFRRYDYCSNCVGHGGAPKCAGCRRDMQLSYLHYSTATNDASFVGARNLTPHAQTVPHAHAADVSCLALFANCRLSTTDSHPKCWHRCYGQAYSRQGNSVPIDATWQRRK